MVDCNPNNSEKQSYCVNLGVNNFEDDFYAATDQTKLNNSILSDCVYTDVNQTQKYLTSKLIFAITNNKLLYSNASEEDNCFKVNALL